ncbi:MAG: hypothetical protein HEEMFOPI_01809 [Holosporales bacterium]
MIQDSRTNIITCFEGVQKINALWGDISNSSLEAVLYCMFLFVLLMIFLPDGTKMLWFYFKVLIWLQLWAPLFAILNFIMTEALSWQAVSALKGDDGITIGNFVGLTRIRMIWPLLQATFQRVFRCYLG